MRLPFQRKKDSLHDTTGSGIELNDQIPYSRLARSLDLRDAVVIGLSAIIGAGIFSALSPASESAGIGLLIGLLIAGFVAALNARSAAFLASQMPTSGGTYVFADRYLGQFWGYISGWSFVTGKISSCVTMALVIGAYAGGEFEKPVAVTAILFFTFVNYLGIKKTVAVSKTILTVVFVALACVVVSSFWSFPRNQIDNFNFSLRPSMIFQSAGILFFAFAGYARLATLGEEVKNPSRNIPRAIFIALGISLAFYLIVAISALNALGPELLASSPAPLEEVTNVGSFRWMTPVVGIGAAFAAGGALLSLSAGASRTVFAMSSNRHLPQTLAKVHRKNQTPYRADLFVGITVTTIVLFADVASAISFSSFMVLIYYAITNISAIKATPNSYSMRAALSFLGLLGCLVLAFCLPPQTIIIGALVFVIGTFIWPFIRKK